MAQSERRTIRQRKSPGRPQSSARAAVAPTPRRKARWPWILAALIVAGAAFALRPRSKPAPPPPPPHPAERLSAAEANQQGLLLARARRPLAAMAYFRRVIALAPDSWFAHLNHGAALGNAAQEARLHLGKEEIATRASIERVAMVREALRETEVAERLASAPGDRATVLTERARVLYTWGFPLDAIGFYRAAAALAPERRALAEALVRLERELREGPAQ